ncbi:hypothetical protein Mapa_008164 [Marchantia paleacea]|nr:hypothetical protein Mapa_008164 [Marchantia paleacea]
MCSRRFELSTWKIPIRFLSLESKDCSNVRLSSTVPGFQEWVGTRKTEWAMSCSVGDPLALLNALLSLGAGGHRGQSTES